ncbi:MAG: hypothetical protein WD894_25460 [Pirellulales bacterium]
MKVVWKLLSCALLLMIGVFYVLVALSPRGVSPEQQSIQKIAESTGRSVDEVRESLHKYGDWPPGYRR